MYTEKIIFTGDTEGRSSKTLNVNDFSGLVNFKVSNKLPTGSTIETPMPQIRSDYSSLTEWTEGSGAMTDWAIYGNASSNVRVYAEDPFGGQSIVWKAYDDGPDDANAFEGGYNANSTISIDPSKSYRYSVFIKQHDNKDGVIYFGPAQYNTTNAVFYQHTGLWTSDPYFRITDNPEVDEWYLWVGYLNAAGTTPGTKNYDNLAGIYDMSGNKIGGNFNEYTFSSTATTQHARAFYFNDAVNDGAIGTSFWNPRIDVIDGNEPSILELLKLVPSKTYLPPINSDMSALDQWSLGEGDDPSNDWGYQGLENENSRELRTTPYGTTDVVWVGTDTDNTNTKDGGFVHADVDVDNTADYRVSVWVKNNVKTSDATGSTWYIFAGLKATSDPAYEVINAATGLTDLNPYFQSTYAGILDVYGEWHLWVSYIDAAGTSRGALHPDAGIYDTDGNKITATLPNAKSYEWGASTTKQHIRIFQLLNTSEAGDEVEFYHPRIDKLDGNEPTIDELISSHKAKYPRINYPEFAALADWIPDSSGSQSPDWLSNATLTVTEYGIDPFGNNSVILRCVDDDAASDTEGSLYTKNLAVDTTKQYRFSCFVKQQKGGNSVLNFRPKENFGSDPTLALTYRPLGTLNTNPAFLTSWKPDVDDTWYLVVSFISPAGTVGGGETETGVYDMNGSRVPDAPSIAEYSFSSTTTHTNLRMFGAYNSDPTSYDEVLFWGPRIDIVDGTEPTIDELLNQGYPTTQVYGVMKHGSNEIISNYANSKNNCNYTEALDSNNTHWVLGRGTIEASATDPQLWNNATDNSFVFEVTAVSPTPVFYGNTDRNARTTIDADKNVLGSLYVRQPDDPSEAVSGMSVAIYENTPTGRVYTVDFGFDTHGGAPSVTPRSSEVKGGMSDEGNGWYRIWAYIEGLPNAATLNKDTALLYIGFDTAANPSIVGSKMFIAAPQMESGVGITEPSDYHPVWTYDEKHSSDLPLLANLNLANNDTVDKQVIVYPSYDIYTHNNKNNLFVTGVIAHNSGANK